jgi:hypothetical protein
VRHGQQRYASAAFKAPLRVGVHLSGGRPRAAGRQHRIFNAQAQLLITACQTSFSRHWRRRAGLRKSAIACFASCSVVGNSIFSAPRLLARSA